MEGSCACGQQADFLRSRAGSSTQTHRDTMGARCSGRGTRHTQRAARKEGVAHTGRFSARKERSGLTTTDVAQFQPQTSLKDGPEADDLMTLSEQLEKKPRRRRRCGTRPWAEPWHVPIPVEGEGGQYVRVTLRNGLQSRVVLTSGYRCGDTQRLLHPNSTRPATSKCGKGQCAVYQSSLSPCNSGTVIDLNLNEAYLLFRFSLSTAYLNRLNVD